MRTLAQRRAEAAKESKTLITRSVEPVEQGTGQVGEAVVPRDRTTQQHTALVNESATAESLKQQTQLLVQAVSVCRTAETV